MFLVPWVPGRYHNVLGGGGRDELKDVGVQRPAKNDRRVLRELFTA